MDGGDDRVCVGMNRWVARRVQDKAAQGDFACSLASGVIFAGVDPALCCGGRCRQAEVYSDYTQ